MLSNSTDWTCSGRCQPIFITTARSALFQLHQSGWRRKYPTRKGMRWLPSYIPESKGRLTQLPETNISVSETALINPTKVGFSCIVILTWYLRSELETLYETLGTCFGTVSGLEMLLLWAHCMLGESFFWLWTNNLLQTCWNQGAVSNKEECMAVNYCANSSAYPSGSGTLCERYCLAGSHSVIRLARYLKEHARTSMDGEWNRRMEDI